MKEPINMSGGIADAMATISREFARVWAALGVHSPAIPLTCGMKCSRIDGVSTIRASMLARAIAITFNETMFEDSKEWTLIDQLEQSKDEFWRMVGTALKDEFHRSLVKTQ
ncbi:hypothetical protein PCO31111_04508 [Pandoraea communis]|uniref:Uncharacterized protein n=1 Tax=Pandoraea communis TaxID=2508297 RepID=A0A5E4YFX7_9BURK|nr:hypothetical protein [Pandoraea communis]VVE47308.1 hypothetical protein PCO31111_04508 [Pandoraea communis]